MRRRLLVGLTGAIGAGKSEALRAFAAAGAETHSADALSHELSRRGGPVYRAVVAAMGRGVLKPDGGLDRRRIAEAVFRDPAALRRLERASHPGILKELSRRMAEGRRPVAVIDVPLLFEKRMEKEFDLTVCVTAPAGLRAARVLRRDGGSRAAARRRARAQWPEARKAGMADVVIPNGGPRAALRRAVAEYQQAFELLASGLGGRT
ncbi:MAG: dephospho-CoA kinase [Elusimicrobia bacterium]|nr:dephospho-CoA kinase [Elusimicrobiota bacterium]